MELWGSGRGARFPTTRGNPSLGVFILSTVSPPCHDDGDLLEVYGLLAYTSGGVGTCLLSFAEEEIEASGSRGLSAWGMLNWVNKVGGIPRVPSSAKMKS
jgi:hypothetical protein